MAVKKSSSVRVSSTNGRPLKTTKSTTITTTPDGPSHYQKKYPFSSFLNVGTFVLLFIMVMLASTLIFWKSSIYTYMPNFDNNQVGSVPVLMNDLPIAELNGLSLNEVFGKNKISDGFILNSISDPTYMIINKLFTNNDYIIIIKGKIDVRTQPYAIRFRNNITNVSSSINPVFNNEYNNVFLKLETNDIPNNLYFVRNYVEDTSLFVDYIYVIDLSMFTVEPTVEQMDYYYNLYNKQIGKTYIDYYHISVEEYKDLGNVAFAGFVGMFSEGGVIYFLKNMGVRIGAFFEWSIGALNDIYLWFYPSKGHPFLDTDDIFKDPNAPYNPPPKSNIFKDIYRGLPKFLQPDTWGLFN